MSVIIKGDTTKLLGEHLPTPYIDKILVQGAGDAASLRIYLSIHMPADETKSFASSTDHINVASNAYVPYMTGLKYYIALSIPNSNAKPVWDAHYEEIKKGNPDANPLAIAAGAYEYTKWLVDTGTISPMPHHESYSPFLLFEVDFSSASYTIIYDEDGNEIRKYTVGKVIPLRDPYDTGLDTNWIFHDAARQSWDAIANMQVYAFSSTIDYKEAMDTRAMYEKYITPVDLDPAYETFPMLDAFSLFIDLVRPELGTTAAGTVSVRPLLDMETSAVAYEKVFEDGMIANKDSVEYFDSEDMPYIETPLVSIDSAIYKVDKINHAQIVDKMQEVLDRYQIQYSKKRGFKNLKNLYNSISTILTTKANDPYLLPRLATLQRTWPHKLPAKPVGKLYKDFRKNIFVVNKAIKSAGRLYPRIKYSAKVVDLRPQPINDEYTPLYKSDWESNLTDYVYNSSFMATKMNVYYNSTVSKTKDVVYGMAFFDYEKSLTYTSDVSRVLDIRKLESWGLPIAYSQFYVTQARFNRESGLKFSGEDVRIISFLAGPVPDNATAGTLTVEEYPYTKWVRISDYSDSKKVRRKVEYGSDDDYTTALAGTPYYPPPPDSYTTTTTETILTTIHKKSFDAYTGTADMREDTINSHWDSLQRWYAARLDEHGISDSSAAEISNCSRNGSLSDTIVKSSTSACEVDKLPYGWPDRYPADSFVVTTDYTAGDWGDPLFNTTWKFHLNRSYTETTSGTTTEEYEATDIGAGYLASMTLRPFANLGSALSSEIDNYRLMCFDLLDYQINSHADKYTFKITIKDKTSEVLVELIKTFKEAHDIITKYYELCLEQCSFNATTGLFNDFFKENIITYYDADPENSPWFRVPFIYCMHQDLYYDTFQGDLEKIKKAAIMISQQVDPAGGTLAGIRTLMRSMDLLNAAIYESGGRVYEVLDDLGAVDTFGVIKPVTSTNRYEADYTMPTAYDAVDVGPTGEVEAMARDTDDMEF